MIKINDSYTILGRDLNFIVECSNENREVNPDELEKNSSKRNKYFSTIEGLCSFLTSQDNIDEDNLTKLRNVSDKVLNVYNSFLDIELEKNRKVKIDVDGTWFIIGTYACYRIIKKEYIKESRFTKEENIGKDKFITYGFSPNLYIALKIILSESLLDFLSKEDNSSIEDVECHIDKMVSSINSMVIVDTDETDIDNDEDEEYTDSVEEN